MIRISEAAINFNKEILFGEIGSLTGALLFAYTSTFFFSSSDALSTATVAGSLITASLFWLGMRIYDKKKENHFSNKEVVRDVVSFVTYFTPVAFVLAMLIYYPSLFFLSNYFFENNYKLIPSVLIAQASAFCLFLVSVNLYRYSLFKLTGKKL